MRSLLLLLAVLLIPAPATSAPAPTAPAAPAPDHAAPAPAMRGEVQVDGLACPFCAYGLEKKLHALSWLDSIQIFVDEGAVRFVVPDGDRPDLAALDAAVKDGGFTPRGARFEVSGVAKAEGEARYLSLASGARVDLQVGDERAAVQRAVEEARTITVAGPATQRGDGRLRLTVESVADAP